MTPAIPPPSAGEPAGEPPPPQQRRRRGPWIVFGLVLMLLIGFLVYAAVNARDSSRVQRALAELDERDPGWRLEEIEKARAVVPEPENGGAVTMAVASLLPSGGFPPQSVDDLLRDVPPEKQFHPTQVAALTTLLETHQGAVLQARLLADRPRGRLPLVYGTPTLNTLLKDQQDVRQSATLLRYDAFRHAQAGDPAAALRSVRGILHSGAVLGDEPFIISNLIRVACVTIGTSTLERILAQTTPAAADLRAVEVSLAREEAYDEFKVGMRGERAIAFKTMDEIASGKFGVDIVSGGKPSEWSKLQSWWQGGSVRGEIPLLLDILTQRLEACDRPLHEQHLADTEADAAANSLPRAAVMTRLLLPALTKVSQAHVRKVAVLRCARVACAAERYRQEKGAWPTSVGELVTGKYLGELPLDPNDGLPLRLKKLPTGLIVYSVGVDRTDDGGTLDRRAPTRAGADIGFQLWNPELRRQPPDPPPPPVEQ